MLWLSSRLQAASVARNHVPSTVQRSSNLVFPNQQAKSAQEAASASPWQPQPGDPSREPTRHGSWDFDAVIFDLDGVITDTAAVHSAAWKRTFDDYLRIREAKYGEPFKEFSHAYDYINYVDGKPRSQGVRAFLESRHIDLPPGAPDDPVRAETICGLGNRKNELFREIVETDGVRVYTSTLVLIDDLRKEGIKVALATSSKNSAIVLAKTQTGSFYSTIVDGIVSERMQLKGKPHPDIFVTACANLGVSCSRAVVVEDAVSGVRAGARGGFGLVLGVARDNNARELLENGADVVVSDLATVNVEEINRQIRLKRTSAIL